MASAALILGHAAITTPAPLPTVSTQTASYNNLNQLTNLSGQGLAYDANGNLLSDGPRTYSWDAENRLIGISYPGQPGKATSFAYDGLGRCYQTSSMPAGGGTPVVTSYVWCDDAICQSRDGSGAVARAYYAEGEYVPGATPQRLFYGIDQIGSVRQVFASTTSAPAYDYDPYGNPLPGTAPVTDVGYAGMWANADSGLNLTHYRAYDPVAGRFISRDPIGEAGDPQGNLYAYVGGNPVNLVDPLGLSACKNKA